MAKQSGDIKLRGTFDDLCFYQMDGVYYVRRKSCLTGKRFQKDNAFAASRKSATRFAEGNRLASKIYRLVDKENRRYRLFCFLKRKCILLLKEGKTLTEAEVVLIDYLVTFRLLNVGKPKVLAAKNKVSSTLVLQAKAGWSAGWTTAETTRNNISTIAYYRSAPLPAICSLSPPAD